MEIAKSNKVKNFVIDKLRQSFSEDRKGIHLTDLMYPMKAYWRFINPLLPSEVETLYFIAGKAHETELLERIELCHSPDYEKHGIYFSPDTESIVNINGEEMFIPWEIKTMRRGRVVEDNIAEEFGNYIEQLKGYCALLDKNVGILCIFYLVKKIDNFRTRPDIDIYIVTFTDEELKEHLDKLLTIRNDLMIAIDSKNREGLAYCPEWMCVDRESKLISKAVCTVCGKELNSNQIKKHDCGGDISMPVYEEIVTEKCRWYKQCKEG